VDLESGTEFRLPIATRGHGGAVHPGRPHIVLVARRPGREFYVFDWESASLLNTVASRPSRHFFGHAVFDASGRYLYAVENVYDDSPAPDLTPQNACIGVYDAEDGYRGVREMSTHGVGAHELRFMPDQRTLVVANGGIYTHPSLDREKLNVDTMDPSLAFIDAATGVLLSQHRLEDHQLSIRHLAVRGDGAVVVGLQYEGPAENDVPLLAMHQHEVLEPMEAPVEVVRSLDHYIASVAIHEPTGRIAATSPRGNRTVFFEGSGAFLRAIDATDVSGLAALDNHFLVSAGTGHIYLVDARSVEVQHEFTSENAQWDNHLSVVEL